MAPSLTGVMYEALGICCLQLRRKVDMSTRGCRRRDPSSVSKIKPCYALTYTLGRPLSHDVFLCFLLEVRVTNWAAQ